MTVKMPKACKPEDHRFRYSKTLSHNNRNEDAYSCRKCGRVVYGRREE